MSPRPSAGPAGADPAVTTPRGFDIVPTLSTRPQWFPCGPLPVRHLTWFFPGLFLLCSRPWLLTTAAGGGLKPAPASRFRGAVPHRLDSYALRRSFRSPSRSWRTVVRVPQNLCARIPDGVSDEAAAFTVLGAIALQGIRLMQPTLGESIVVIGLGLVGLLTVQLL